MAVNSFLVMDSANLQKHLLRETLGQDSAIFVMVEQKLGFNMFDSFYNKFKIDNVFEMSV